MRECHRQKDDNMELSGDTQFGRMKNNGQKTCTCGMYLKTDRTIFFIIFKISEQFQILFICQKSDDDTARFIPKRD